MNSSELMTKCVVPPSAGSSTSTRFDPAGASPKSSQRIEQSSGLSRIVSGLQDV